MACSCGVRWVGVMVAVLYLVRTNIDTNPGKSSKVLPLWRIVLLEL